MPTASGSPSAAITRPRAKPAIASSLGSDEPAATAASFAAVASAPSRSPWASRTSTDRSRKGAESTFSSPIAFSRRCRTAAAIAVSPRARYSDASAWVDSGSSSNPARSCSASSMRPWVDPELGELGGRVDAPRPQVGCLHRLQSLGEHPVGHLPVARGDEHLRAAGVAEPKHRDVVVRGDPSLDGLPPLLDALPIGGELARGDTDADHVPDHLEARHLAAGRGRERLVHLRHPRHNVAGRDLRVAEPNERRGLEVAVAEPPRRRDGFERVRSHLGGAIGSLGTGERQPALLRNTSCVPHHPLGPRVPARAHRRVPVGGRELAGEPERIRDRRTELARLAVGGVRALHVRDRPLGVLEPPERAAESLLGPGRRPLAQRTFEHRPRPRPVAGGKSLLSGEERIGRSVDRHDPDDGTKVALARTSVARRRIAAGWGGGASAMVRRPSGARRSCTPSAP